MALETPKPPPHPGAAVLAIGGMALVLGVAVQLTGFAGKLDGVIAGWVSGSGLGGKFRNLPGYAAWLWTVPLVFGLAATMLASRRNWRRAVLWTTTVVLTLGWIPVLALSAYRPVVTMPVFSLLWCGLWAMIYATRHQEPGDESE